MIQLSEEIMNMKYFVKWSKKVAEYVEPKNFHLTRDEVLIILGAVYLAETGSTRINPSSISRVIGRSRMYTWYKLVGKIERIYPKYIVNVSKTRYRRYEVQKRAYTMIKKIFKNT